MESKFKSELEKLEKLESERDSNFPLIIAFVAIGIMIIGCYFLF
jgi:hypothetical protein